MQQLTTLGLNIPRIGVVNDFPLVLCSMNVDYELSVVWRLRKFSAFAYGYRRALGALQTRSDDTFVLLTHIFFDNLLKCLIKEIDIVALHSEDWNVEKYKPLKKNLSAWSFMVIDRGIRVLWGHSSNVSVWHAGHFAIVRRMTVLHALQSGKVRPLCFKNFQADRPLIGQKWQNHPDKMKVSFRLRKISCHRFHLKQRWTAFRRDVSFLFHSALLLCSAESSNQMLLWFFQVSSEGPMHTTWRIL